MSSAGTPLPRTAPVSVVIPIRNRAGWIAAALDSVRAQTLPPAEIIVVDDGSTDDLAAVMQHDPAVRLIHLPPSGLGPAWNAGIAAAGQPFIAFLDSDDIWLPRKLETQMPLFERDEVGVVFADSLVRHVEASGETWLRRATRFDRVPPSDCTFAGFVRRNPVPFSTVVARRTLFDATGPFDPKARRSADWAWLCRASLVCELAAIREPLAEYRVHAGNVSANLKTVAEDQFSHWQELLDIVEGANRSLVRRQLLAQRIHAALLRLARSSHAPKLPPRRVDESAGALRACAWGASYLGRFAFVRARRLFSARA